MTKIEEAAKHLGELIREHPSAKTFSAATESLDKDIATQRLITDFNRHLQKLAEKQHAGKPIEVEDKHKLEQLQSAVAAHPLIAHMQQSQMDYLDVMRKAMVLVAQTAGGEEALDEGMDMPATGGAGLVH
ncbi:MAG: YlbF family regulator [Phycisphaeraceae bacterium]